MGGVDLADMRRLHCNSTLMGQNRWWLKLFFYNLDVGTANALVLYRAAIESNDMNIAAFKEKLVLGLVGSRIEDVSKGPINATHELVLTDKRRKCVYCALFSKNKKNELDIYVMLIVVIYLFVPLVQVNQKVVRIALL